MESICSLTSPSRAREVGGKADPPTSSTNPLPQLLHPLTLFFKHRHVSLDLRRRRRRRRRFWSVVPV